MDNGMIWVPMLGRSLFVLATTFYRSEELGSAPLWDFSFAQDIEPEGIAKESLSCIIQAFFKLRYSLKGITDGIPRQTLCLVSRFSFILKNPKPVAQQNTI